MKVSHYLMAATAIVLASCGGGGSNQSSESTDSETTTDGVESIGVAEDTGDAGAAAEADVTLTLNADDMMRFDKKELKVKAGQKVSLTLNHTGKLGKDVMGHNFVLLKPDVDLADFAAKALNARENDYIPESESGSIITHTKLLGGGESDTIVFTAPAAGTYTFICSFPGHYGVMQGQFIVE